jgi:hypothetical protein
MAYSIVFSLEALRRFGESPHQDKENNRDADVKSVQHDSPQL